MSLLMCETLHSVTFTLASVETTVIRAMLSLLVVENRAQLAENMSKNVVRNRIGLHIQPYLLQDSVPGADTRIRTQQHVWYMAE